MPSEVEVNIKLNASELKKGIKDAKNELAKADFGSEAYDKATKKLHELQEALGDVTDQAKIQGSAVERLGGSFGLLKEGFLNADPGKIGIAFKGLTSAMSAVPVFLLIEGFKLLADNFDKVIEFGKQLFNLFSEDERAVRKLTAELEHQKLITSALTGELQREIDIMEAQGVSSDILLKKKKELIASQIQEAWVTAQLNVAKANEVQNNDNLLESALRLQLQNAKLFNQTEKIALFEKAIEASKSERNKENIKAARESLELIKNLQTKAKVEEINNENDKNNKIKDLRKQKLEDEKKAFEDALAQQEAAENERTRILQIDKKNQQEQAKEEQKLQEERAKNLQELRDLQLKANQEEAATFIEKERQLTIAKKAESDARYNIEKQSVQSAQMLSELLFQAQIQGAEGDEAKQLEIKRKAFEVNKAFQASQAQIDAVRATLSAYATAPPGFKIAAAVSAGVFGELQVAKILSAKFNAGPSSKVSPNVASGGGSASGGGAPLGGQIQQGTGTGDKSTTFNEQGQQTGNWISVVEINNTQKRVAKMSEQARF